MISMYTVPWQARLGYSSMHVNLLSSAGSLGSYLTPPLLGVLSDSHGPVILTWLSFFGFVPSYLYLAHVFATEETWFPGSLVAFFIIGVATSSMFFGALLACAKLHPKTKLLSISFPTTCYGLSSLIGSQVVQLPLFQSDSGYLDLTKVFRTFAVFYTLVFLLTWVSTSTVSIIKLRDLPADTEDERQALLSTTPEVVLMSKTSKFFRDPVAYVLLFIMLLSLGILEMFVTDMGSITSLVVDYKSTYTVLPYFAFFSTASRLSCGLAIDLLTKFKISRMFIVMALLITGLVSQLLIMQSMNLSNKAYLAIASALSGVSYGGLFTTFPALTLNIWGDDVFGTAYGTFMLGPAIGTATFGIFYAKSYDAKCAAENSLASCIVPVFRSTFLYLILSLVVTIGLTVKSRRVAQA